MYKLNLDNNCYLEVLDNESAPKISNMVKIENCSITNNDGTILFIDFCKIKPKKYKKIIKKILAINTINNKKIGKVNENYKFIGYLMNYNENDELQNDFISALNAIFYKNKKERYNYIYDTVCDYLDNFFYGENLCDFKNNQCGEKCGTSSYIGCCHHYKNKLLGPLLSNNLTPCEYLKEDYTCGAECIGCKLFTCDYLRKKGVKFNIKDIFLLDVFFNTLQKYYIKTMVFTPKEKIIKKLLHSTWAR